MFVLRSSLALFLSLVSSCAVASTVTVLRVTNTQDSGPGSLRQAIESINASPLEGSFAIEFYLFHFPLVSVFHELPEINRPGRDISIDGAGTPGLVISGHGTAALIRARGFGSLSIRNLSLVWGRSGGGACLRAVDASGEASQIIVDNVQFTNCVAGAEGGAAILAGNSLRVSNSRFHSNRVDLRSPETGGGAAIMKRGIGSLEIESSIFDNNSVLGDGWTGVAAKGGAVLINGGGFSHTIRGSRFTSNRASGPGGAMVGQGGAINIQAGALRVENSYVHGSYANQLGGAIAIERGDLGEIVIENTTFEANLSQVGGALFYNDNRAQGSQLTIRNSLFKGNVSRGHGNSIDVSGIGTTLQVSHTAFESSVSDPPQSPMHCTGVAQDYGSNAISGPGSLGCGLSGTVMASFGLLGSAPSLPAGVPVAYAVSPESPLVDGGAAHSGSHAFPFTCSTSDARGEARPHSSGNEVPPACDIGPLEVFQSTFSDGFES